MMKTYVRYRRSAASAYLKDAWGVDYKTNTLAKLACLGGGPRFEHFGRWPLYRKEELDAWAAARLSPLKISTSDHGQTSNVASTDKETV